MGLSGADLVGVAALSEGAVEVLKRRYLARGPSGRVETPEEMFRRVASNVASVEARWVSGASVAKTVEDFFTMMASLEFLPNSPTLMNAGRKLQQLAACFVIPVDDSLDSIFEAVKETALIHQSGGGTGFSFSSLRPSDDLVDSTGGAASGPVSFMRVFNAATEAVRQGGARRGANMGVLRVDHPDVAAFIRAKEDPRELINFNLSVAVTDAYMAALAAGADYDLVNPRTGKSVRRASAAELFDLIARCAWASGEPGVLFIDRINAANPTPKLGRIEATNPCGEQPLLAHEPCNLGSINLSLMAKKGALGWKLDREKLERTVRLAVRFLDDVVEACKYPNEAIRKMAHGNRKIGLGVMGFADLLGLMRLPYDSPEALAAAGELMGLISTVGRDESAALAAERGPFPNFAGSVFDGPGMRPVRNATVTTIAPTGTLSIIAGVSSGIEPYYALSYIRRALGDAEMRETARAFEVAAREEGCYSAALMDHLGRGGPLGERVEVPERLKRVFAAAHEIAPEAHVRMQAAFQKSTDNAVSKTINLPEPATPEDVARAYLLAYKLGCKGVTVYRAGSRREQVLSCGALPYC